MYTHQVSYEQGPIRPPSEADSLLLRLTRNCPWNRCYFCPVYKGQKFSRRGVDEVKGDVDAIAAAIGYLKELSVRQGKDGRITREILQLVSQNRQDLLPVAWWLHRGAGSVFLQDGDSLILPTTELLTILDYLRIKVPGITRITVYARSRTLLRKSVADLTQLKQVGVDRIHVGLESGSDKVLQYVEKGVTRQQHIEAGQKVKAAGISLSEYVLLGLGGQEMWQEHALSTAEALRAIDPDYIRLRTLAVIPTTPLYEKFADGDFAPLDDEGVLREEELMLTNLREVNSRLLSDHFSNLLEEVAGKLPLDMEHFLGVIANYFSLGEDERERFRLGRRAGVYRYLGDMHNPVLSAKVENLYTQLLSSNLTVDEYIQRLMLGNL